jgi:hypothetical protein
MIEKEQILKIIFVMIYFSIFLKNNQNRGFFFGIYLTQKQQVKDVSCT